MLIAVVEGEKADMVLEFWKRFNIRMAIATIAEAVVSDTRVLHAVWWKILIDLIHDFEVFTPSENLFFNSEQAILILI